MLPGLPSAGRKPQSIRGSAHGGARDIADMSPGHHVLQPLDQKFEQMISPRLPTHGQPGRAAPGSLPLAAGAAEPASLDDMHGGAGSVPIDSGLSATTLFVWCARVAYGSWGRMLPCAPCSNLAAATPA